VSTCGAAHDLIVRWHESLERQAEREAEANAEEHGTILDEVQKDRDETRTTASKVDRLCNLVEPLVEKARANNDAATKANRRADEAHARIDWWRNTAAALALALGLTGTWVYALESPDERAVSVARGVLARHSSAAHDAPTTAPDVPDAPRGGGS
jgi:hypothetical protein